MVGLEGCLAGRGGEAAGPLGPALMLGEEGNLDADFSAFEQVDEIAGCIAYANLAAMLADVKAADLPLRAIAGPREP